MRLVCPNCRGIASLEAWENEPVIMDFLTARASLPTEINPLVPQYLRLFRPHGNRGLAWKKALRLVIELRDLVAAGHVQWKRRPARQCPPAIWAEAMERMINRPPADLPVESHGYLTSIAYGLADDADKIAERSKVAGERSGAGRGGRDAMDGPEEIGEVLDRDWMRETRLKAGGKRPEGKN